MMRTLAVLVFCLFAAPVASQRHSGTTGRSPVATGPISPGASFELKWAHLLDGGILKADRWKAVDTDSQGNAIVVGDIQSSQGGHSAVLKLDANGHALWLATYQGPGSGFLEHGIDVEVLPDDSILTLATSPGIPAGVASRNQDIVLSHYAPDGTVLWRTVYDHEWNDSAASLAVGPDGSIYLLAQSYFGPPNNDIVLVSFDSSGAQKWETHWDGPANNDSPTHIVVDVLNRIYVGGQTESPGINNVDWVILAYDSSGNLLWENRFGGTSLAPDFLSGSHSAQEEGSWRRVP